MHFLLTTLKVVYVLSTRYPLKLEEETETDKKKKEERVRKQQKWDNDDYICMEDSLFDIYQNYESAHKL